MSKVILTLLLSLGSLPLISQTEALSFFPREHDLDYPCVWYLGPCEAPPPE